MSERCSEGEDYDYKHQWVENYQDVIGNQGLFVEDITDYDEDGVPTQVSISVSQACYNCGVEQDVGIYGFTRNDWT